MFETFFEDHICCFDRLLIISSTELGFNAENKSRQRMTKPLLFEDFSEIFDYMTFYFALRKNEGKKGMKLCKFKTIKFSHTSIIFPIKMFALYLNNCFTRQRLVSHLDKTCRNSKRRSYTAGTLLISLRQV